MIRVERAEAEEFLQHAGRSFTLVSSTWTVALTTPRLAIGWRYHQPRRVESGLESASIHDHLMMVRVTAVLIFSVTFVARLSGR